MTQGEEEKEKERQANGLDRRVAGNDVHLSPG